MLANIQVKLDMIEKYLKVNAANEEHDHSEAEDSFADILPLQSVSEFEQLDRMLQDKAVANKLVSLVSLVYFVMFLKLH